MATITQTIPSYIYGISQQPDTLKTPGQLKAAKNVIPDVTEGLMKRPGGRLIDSLSDNSTSSKNSVTTGRWFSYYRDEAEQYIGQIARDGVVRIWRCSDGAPQTVNYSTTAPAAGQSAPDETKLKLYLNHNADDDLQVLTLNDVTYVTNRATLKNDGSTAHPKTTVAMRSDVVAARPPEAYFEVKKISYASQYSANIYDNTTETEISTATRIRVQRTHDSSNGCNSEGRLSGMPNQGHLCSDGLGTGGVNTEPGQDAFCPNVDTRIFNISHNDNGDTADANGEAWAITVTPGSGSPAVTATARKDLYLRIITLGQSVPQGGSATNPDYRCRYTTTHDLLYGGQGWYEGDWFYVWMKNARYKVTVIEASVAKVKANLAAARPSPTPFDNESTVTVESILGALETEIIAGGTFTDANISIVGNGLYVTRASGAFNANSPASDLLNVMTDRVNTIDDLPNQCKHGYVVRIANTVEDEDDWYVQFKGHNDQDGTGSWEECAKPGRKFKFDSETLPIQIIRNADGTFTVDHCVWEDALVGDDLTNPEPSFVGSKIRKMIFFRNRLCFMSDENIILSRPGLDKFDFWNKTALTFTNIDPIDLSVGSDKPAVIYDAIQVNTGLILFTKTQQFMLTTDSDILSPNTAKINTLASYNFNSETNPISMGTTVGWLDNAGQNSRFFEMERTLREGEPNVAEQSKIVSRLFNKDLRLISNSRENGIIFFSEIGTSTIYCYRYFNAEAKRIQAAWFTWEVPGAIQHHCVLDDSFYVITRGGGKDQMLRFDIKLSDDSRTVTDDLHTTTTDDDIKYRLHLDMSKPVNVTTQIYNATTDKSTFAKPVGYEYSDKTLVAYDVTIGDHYPDIGRYDEATLSGSNVVLDGNWSRRINQVNLVNTGSGYTSAPAVTFSGGGGTGAAATATVTDGKISAITVTNNGQNYTSTPTIAIAAPSSGTTATANCTIDSDFVLGYLFDYEVQFPTIYRTAQVNQKFRSDIEGSLIVQRLKLNLGNAGLYKTTIKRTGKDDYTETWEPAKADTYLANSVDFVESVTQTIPTYEKNTNLSVTLTSSHPAPATLYSMSWEGDYTNKFYQRV